MFERQDTLTKEEVFMNMAKIYAMQSMDPNTQVGACIVKDDTILSFGYNDIPRGYPIKKFPWAREGNPLETKYLFVCHAELNAIANYQGLKENLKGSTIYVTLFPCSECAKNIIQSGIKEVVYESDKYANTDSVIASKMMFDECDITYRQMDTTIDIVVNKEGKRKQLV